MDELDAAIFRELHRDRSFLWGGIDIRLGTTALAERLDVDRSTIWARLNAWEEGGFLVGQEVLPNPSLFGAGVAGGDIRVDDPRDKPEVFSSLELVDGVLAWVDQLGPWVLVAYARETAGGLDRCRRLVGELPGVDEASMCIPFRGPESLIEPTDRDWHILAGLRKDPDRPLAEVAEEVGVSRRTLTRRYSQLIETQAIWSFPTFDFSRYEGAAIARFVATLPADRDSADLVNASRREVPGVVWVERLDGLAPDNPYEFSWVDLYVHLAAPGDAEPIQGWLLDRPDVEDVEIFWPRAWHVVTDWFDERVRARIEGTGKHAR